MNDGQTLRRVREFVNIHASGPLWVCTGSTSAWGLAELARLAPKRPVLLVLGKVSESVSTKSAPEDRRAAIAFLRRPDVRVQSWYRKKRDDLPKRTMHIKAFIADPDGRTPAALTGSANLTRAGLVENQEVMSEISERDTRLLISQVRDLIDRHDDQNEQVIARLERGATDAPARTSASDSEPAQRARGRTHVPVPSEPGAPSTAGPYGTTPRARHRTEGRAPQWEPGLGALPFVLALIALALATPVLITIVAFGGSSWLLFGIPIVPVLVFLGILLFGA